MLRRVLVVLRLECGDDDAGHVDAGGCEEDPPTCEGCSDDTVAPECSSEGWVCPSFRCLDIRVDSGPGDAGPRGDAGPDSGRDIAPDAGPDSGTGDDCTTAQP